MWVAKIGGSLHASPLLASWLAGFCDDTQRRWLLVPGGGPYADAVRAEQRAAGYDDFTAHTRAMAAMARYGEDLLGLEPRLVRASSLGACAGGPARDTRGPPVWCPSPSDVLALDDLPADWRVSADSLAHAVAARLGATALVLIKSVPPQGPPPPAGPKVSVLAASGYVDAWLPRRLAAVPTLPVYWIAAAPGAAWRFDPASWALPSHRIGCS